MSQSTQAAPTRFFSAVDSDSLCLAFFRPYILFTNHPSHIQLAITSMRSFDSRQAIRGHAQARQHLAPRQDTSFSVYFATDGGAQTISGNLGLPTASGLIFDSIAPIYTIGPTGTRNVPSVPTTTSASQSTGGTTADLTPTLATAALNAQATSTYILDPTQLVHDALTTMPTVVIGIASGGTALIVLLALYCYICQWYYRRLPRSTKRWDVDDKTKKDVLYGDKPRFSPEDGQPPHLGDDRRGVAVGDSYFPQGETWKKFEGRTAHHPESFIYDGPGLPRDMGPLTPDRTSIGTTPNSTIPLARPRPQFVQNGRRAQIESVFSNVSFPTTHRADSIRHSFYPEGYEHDGEVWDLASPGLGSDGQPRPSFDSGMRSVNRGSIFGEASARARGSVVIYDSHPSGPLRSPGLVEDPFAGSGEYKGRTSSSTDRFAGKKSFEIRHVRNGSHGGEVYQLDTLAEDEESSSQGHGTVTSKSKYAI